MNDIMDNLTAIATPLVLADITGDIDITLTKEHTLPTPNQVFLVDFTPAP